MSIGLILKIVKMYVTTKTGARSVFYEGPHPSFNGGGEIVYRYHEEVSEPTSEPAKKKPMLDVFKCPQCKTIVPSKVIRHTPKRGFACLRCIVKLGEKCYIHLN